MKTRITLALFLAARASASLLGCLPSVGIEPDDAGGSPGAAPPSGVDGEANSANADGSGDRSAPGSGDPDVGDVDDLSAAATGGASAAPLTIVALQPVDSTLDAPPDGPLSLSFSEPLDPTSLSTSSLELTRSGSVPVTGSVVVEGAVIRFVPAEPLVLANAYTLRLEGTLRTAAGDEWSGVEEVTFRTRDGAWSPPENIAASGNQPRAAFDAEGNALAIYNQPDPASSGSAVLGMALFTPGAPWQTLPVAPEGCPGPCTPLVVTGGSAGEFGLVWSTTESVNAQRFSPGGGFGELSRTSAAGESYADAVIAGGQLWVLADVPAGIVASHTADGSFWSPQVQPFARAGLPRAGPALVINGPQTARAFWTEGSTLFGMTLSEGPGSTPQPISTWEYEDATALTGTGSAAAGALIVWELGQPSSDIPGFVDSQLQLLFVAPDGTSRRATPNLPNGYVGNSFAPAVSMNATGDALLSWVQSPGNADDATATGRAWAAFRSSASPSWSLAVTLSSSANVRARPPALGIDASGNGHAIWVEADASDRAQVVGTRFIRDGAMLDTDEVESGTFGAAKVISGGAPVSAALARGKRSGNDNCQLVVDARGRALALWASPTGGLWAARFE